MDAVLRRVAVLAFRETGTNAQVQFERSGAVLSDVEADRLSQQPTVRKRVSSGRDAERAERFERRFQRRVARSTITFK